MLQTGHSSLDLQEKSLLICRAGQLKAPSDKDCSTTNDNSESGRHEIENDNIESFSDANMLNRTPGDSLTATKRVGASLNNPDATICNNEATTSNPTTAAGVVSNLGASSCNEDATSCNSDATKYNADATLCNTGKIVPNTEDIKNEDEIIGIQSKDSAENCLRGDASVLVIDTKVESKQQPEDCKYCVETVVTRDGEENMEYLAKSRDKYDAKKREVNIVEDYEAHIEEPFIVAINRCNSKSKSTVRLSLISNSSTEGHCRICHCGGEDETLISPCSCSGSLQYVHESCLVHWMQSKMVDSCELCQRKIEVVRKVKPFCSVRKISYFFGFSSILRRLVYHTTFVNECIGKINQHIHIPPSKCPVEWSDIHRGGFGRKI